MDRIPVDDGYPDILLLGEVNHTVHFKLVIREYQAKTFLQQDPFLSQVADRPDAVEPEPAARIRIMEVGVHGGLGHGSIARSWAEAPAALSTETPEIPLG
jgi:hypothetical protein